MKENASLEERFDGWFVEPVRVLRELPDGDGGFVALAVGLFLLERYYRTITNTQDKSKPTEFKRAAARDLGLSDEDMDLFWRVYRNGVLHQGMPKRVRSKGTDYAWRMSEDFSGVPHVYAVDAKTWEIRVNPWKLVDLMVEKFRSDLRVLSQAMDHAFGEVTGMQ